MRKKLIAVLAGLALFATITGTGILADTVGLSATTAVHACQGGGHSGGGC